MLIDYISIEKLPFWIVYMDWNFYTYKPSLLLFLFFGFICWIVYCFVRYGYAVG